MQRRGGVSWVGVVGAILLCAACSPDATQMNQKPPGPCTDKAGCAANQYCAAGTCTPTLAPGSPCASGAGHAASDPCASGVCGGNHCCTEACASTDSACAAADCDTSGACVYPVAGSACGPAAGCDGGSFVPASSCDGVGGCALAAAVSCGPYVCANSGCATSCQATAECAVGDYCAAGLCASQEDAGAACVATATSAPAEACHSNICRGNCCAVECATADQVCHVTGCDTSGACIYPGVGIACGPPESCLNGSHTPPSGCGGDGGCAIAAAVPCGLYLCDPAGVTCSAACTGGAPECVAGTYCDAQHCATKVGAGQPCSATSTSSADEACTSALCAVNCCLSSCAADPATNNCQGTCDSAGACTPKTCPSHFGCSGSPTCNTLCATNADCALGSVCDPVGVTACCTPLAAGDTVYVDGSGGDDTTPCCGAQAAPCQTLTHAMDRIAKSAVSGLTLQVLNGDGTTSWTASETYPIHLGWGVTLNAPGLYFVSQAATPSDIFQVYAFDATDTAIVTIKGGAKNLATDAVHIGLDPQIELSVSFQAAYTSAIVGVNDSVVGQTALPLALSAVWLNAGGFSATETTYDLMVGAGAVVTLGPDPVEMGNGRFIGDQRLAALCNTAIYCKGAGAVIRDDPTATSPVLSVESCVGSDLDIEDGCTATLTQGPRLGSPAGTLYWDGTLAGCQASSPSDCVAACNQLAFNGAIVAVGSANVSFGSIAMPGTIRCARFGIDQSTSNKSGSPTVALNGATIDMMEYIACTDTFCNVGGTSVCAGAKILEGTFSATATSFRHAYVGLLLGPNVISADLSGGGNGGNTFGCNGSTYGASSECSEGFDVAPNVGADLINSTGALAINAENATWDEWDSTGATTQVWNCDDTSYSNCTCTGPGCSDYTSPGAPPDGADAIELTTNSIDSTLGAQASSPCY